MQMQNDCVPLTNDGAMAALDRCVRQVRLNLPLYAGRCQNHSSVGGVYPACDNVQWTCGFWPGEIWLAWEHSQKNCFRTAGLSLVDSFYDRIAQKIEVDHHDMGFLYSPSCVAAWNLVGCQRAREAALLAADHLLTRFQPQGDYFQAWGTMGAPENRRFIIDCLLNLPLLYWASRETGDPKYADLAERHAQTCLACSFRPDGSTYHTFFMNPDGTPSHGETCQGYRDDSFWARGQAWGIYGSILSYRYTQDPAFLDAFRRCLAFYLSRLPEDLVPYWDMIFTDGSDEPRDSSAAAIVSCGLLEAAHWLSLSQAPYRSLPRKRERSLIPTAPPPPTEPASLGFGGDPIEEAVRCEQLARQMLGSLTAHYAVPQPVPGTGLLLHGTYSKKSPYNTCTQEGVDECTGWGDYFYMEALTRLTGDWYPYW